MYRRFLNYGDYLSIVTEEALSQLVRDNEDRFALAEEAAEASIVEYLIDNYQIEETLEIGKQIKNYNPQITYPVGAHFYYGNRIHQAIRTINGRKAPISTAYWVEQVGYVESDEIKTYSQQVDYYPNDIVKFSNSFYQCAVVNGPSFNDIRVPGINAWVEVQTSVWVANYEYAVWSPVSYNGLFYALLNTTDIDWTKNPDESDNWGLIGNYDSGYNKYQFSSTEYVVYGDKVFVPSMNVNSDELVANYNICPNDPRNGNIKKHLLRLAVYELHKLISPNNVSSTRITDYETSIMWLRDASRLKINPQIPRKLDEDKNQVTEYAIATFARDYDPNKNPWQI